MTTQNTLANESSEKQQEHKKSLRRSWRTSGPVAKVTAVFSGVAACATAVYAIFAILQWIAISDQLGEMQQQRTVSERQFEASQRPWIVVKSVSALLFKWQPYRGAFTLNVQPKMTFTNLGNYPADHLRISQKLFFADQTPKYDFLSDVTQAQKDFCETESKKTETVESLERVYPSRDGVFTQSLGTNLPDKFQVRQSDRLIAPVLIGCIFYGYLSSSSVHYTGFIYVIERGPKPEEGTGQTSYSLTYGEDVPTARIVFADGYNGNASYN